MDIDKELDNLFKDHPDGDLARAFILHFNVYCHSIDDIVDEKITEPEIVCSTHMMALNLYTSNFYKKYSDRLYPIIRLIHNTWLDSVKMEKSSDMAQQEQAYVLKSVGIEMLLTVIEMLGGYDFRRKHGIAIRESNFKKQNPIYEIH